jgi:hypothetical protein
MKVLREDQDRPLEPGRHLGHFAQTVRAIAQAARTRQTGFAQSEALPVSRKWHVACDYEDAGNSGTEAGVHGKKEEMQWQTTN